MKIGAIIYVSGDKPMEGLKQNFKEFDGTSNKIMRIDEREGSMFSITEKKEGLNQA